MPITNKPEMPDGTNIDVQQVNFEMEDFSQHNLLQMHFLQQTGITKHQKVSYSTLNSLQYYYEQDDGEVESKITTASPSKTQYYTKQQEILPPNIVLENQNNLAQGRNDLQQFSSNPASLSMTEKKLNNYLQQAKFLMNNQQQQQFQPYQQTEAAFVSSSGKIQNVSAQKRAAKMKNYSYDTEVYSNSNKSSTLQQNQLPAHVQNIYQLDSCPSSKILFNALDVFDEEDQRNMKASFSAQKQPTSNKRLAKLEEQKKSLSDTKKNLSKNTKAKKHQPIIQNQSLKGFQAHRSSQASRASKQSGAASVKNADKISINQIVDQFDNMIIEEQNIYGDVYDEDEDDYQQQSYDGLRVLDYDQDDNGNLQQMDLENMKSINKRQASKTEVFSPAAFSQGLHKKNKGSNIPKPQPNSGSKVNQQPQNQGQHKKAISQAFVPEKSQAQIQVKSQPTRNQGLTKKHMTATTSPVIVKLPSDTEVRLGKQISYSAAKKNSKALPTQPSPQKKGRIQNTVEIVEDQQEEEDHKSDQQSKIARFQLQQREFDIINQTISPSSSSSFQFQPKFFKPTQQQRKGSTDELQTVRYDGSRHL